MRSWPLMLLTLVAALAPQTTSAAMATEAEQTATQTQRAAAEALRDEDDLDRLEVTVSAAEATVSGPVPHLFAKNRAIQLMLEIDGIDTVASEIELPETEEDGDIAQQIVKAINDYPFYTIWDYLDPWINQGVVTLNGSVTPDQDKKNDLYSRITKIRGVQDYIDNIEIQSPSSQDENLRASIARNLFSTDHFVRFESMRTPPFHIVVNRSVVTLLGYVQTQIEYLEMERIVRQMGWVLRVDNQLQTVR